MPLVKCKTGDLTDVNNYAILPIELFQSQMPSLKFEHVMFDYS